MTHISASSRGPRGRGRRLIGPLRSITLLAAALATLALVVPGDSGEAIGWALAGAMVLAPFGRVAFLAGRWLQLSDRRYSAVATLLLAEVAVTAVVTLVA